MWEYQEKPIQKCDVYNLLHHIFYVVCTLYEKKTKTHLTNIVECRTYAFSIVINIELLRLSWKLFSTNIQCVSGVDGFHYKRWK